MSKLESYKNINNLNNNELNKSKSQIVLNDNKSKTEENFNYINQKNMQKDLLFFKDDILKDLRLIQKKLKEDFIIQKDEQTNTLNLYEKKIEAQAQKIDYLSNLITESMKKTNLEELLEKLSSKTEENFSKIEYKINTIQKEIRDSLYKHEKLLNETILYPGIIGYECRFSNFHSFIDYVLSNIHQILVYQELLKSYELHKIKNRIDKDLNIIRLQLKSNFKTLSEFTTEKINESEKKMKNILDDYNTNFFNIRVENNEAAKALKNQISEVANSFNKIIEIKNEIDEKYDEQDKKIENIKKDISNNDAELKDEISNVDKKFDLLTNYIDNNISGNDNIMKIGRNFGAFKGRRVQSAKEYIEGKINYNNYNNNFENDYINNKMKKYNFKAESFIKRYIKGKIGIGDMYKHPKDFVKDKKGKNRIETPKIILYKESLSENKLIKNKLNNNQKHLFSLTTVKSIKNKKKYDKINKSFKNSKSNEESLKINSNINSNLNLSDSKNNMEDNLNTNTNNIKTNSKIYNKKNSHSYENKYNNISLSNNENRKNLKIETLDLENVKSIETNNLKMVNNSSQTNKKERSIKIDSITRIPDIDINRVNYPNNEIKKRFQITKSLSDGNYNAAKNNKISFDLDFFYDKKNKKLKQRIKYNNFKSPNNYISNKQTFGNKYIRQQLAKEKTPNNIFKKPKKKLLIIQ